MRSLVFVVLSILVFALAASAAPAAPEMVAPPVMKLYLEHPGIYEVSFSQLVEAGLPAASAIPVAGIGLERDGAQVPMVVVGDEDGVLGPGDSIRFVGRRLGGEVGFLNQYSRDACYFLRFDQRSPARSRPLPAPDAGSDGRPVVLERRLHLEEDRVMLRFSSRPGEPQDSWYWFKLANVGSPSFEQELTCDRLDTDSDRPLRLRVGLRGWSHLAVKPDPEEPDHHVELRLDGRLLETVEWNGQERRTIELEVPLAELAGAHSEAAPLVTRLELRAPQRRFSGTDDLVVDVVMLDFIELEYPCTATLGDVRTRLDAAGGGDHVTLIRAPGADQELVVASEGGAVIGTWPVRASGLELTLPLDERSLWVFPGDQLASPDRVVVDRPSHLLSEDNRADYLMICHRSLMDAARPLAEAHRRRGLAVELIDVEDVYDELNHGVVHPRALKELLAFAYHHWKPPRPRFVLLVGDASWDFKNPTADDSHYADWTYRQREQAAFVKNASTKYAEGAGQNHRNLIPTWGFPTVEGQAASDAWLASIDGDDDLPDLAIGRLPVVKPDEVRAIVEKTIRYMDDPEVGPWRRRVLLITNENRGYQRASDRLAEVLGRRGYASLKVYPQSTEKVNERHTQRLIELFDQGLVAVHFLGHGGRYVWRTGPPDLTKNHDLFTLEHLDQLSSTRDLPVVVSLTCYSAPFDHPNADSIGEKMLRMPSSAAVAVIAASWRNAPSAVMGRRLLEHLLVPGATVGEALDQAKAEVRNVMFRQTYNLLGDPAVPVAVPRYQLALEVEHVGSTIRLHGTVPVESFSGEVIVDWVDAEAEVLTSVKRSIEGPAFTVELDQVTGPVAGVRAYAWSEDAGVDAIGWVEVKRAGSAQGKGPLPAAG